MSLPHPPSRDHTYRVGQVAGASARARYAELRAQGQTLRRAVMGTTTLTAAVLGFALGGWRPALVAALWAIGAVLIWQWRTDQAATWAKGAAGERKTARLLRRLERRGHVVLHDRAIPRSKANLDHLVITPAGTVIVVDSKKWGRNQIVKSGGRRGWVRVGRVRGDKVTRSTEWEAARVAQELTRDLGHAVPVRAVLAIHGGKMPVWRQLAVNGIPLLRARQVPRWITNQPDTPNPVRARQVAEAAQRLFVPYVADPPTTGGTVEGRPR